MCSFSLHLSSLVKSYGLKPATKTPLTATDNLTLYNNVITNIQGVNTFITYSFVSF